MTNSWGERELIRDIIDGLNAAIEANDWDHAALDPIKFNKLLYRAVQRFEVPVTYRWYKYGADFTTHGFSPDSVRPTALEDLPSPDEPRVANPWETEPYHNPTPREIKHYFEDILDPEFFADNTKEYLEEFYSGYAPEEYESLYVKSAKLQKTLDIIGLSDERGMPMFENADVLRDELKALGREILSRDGLEEVVEPYLKYANLLKDIATTVEANDGHISSLQNDVIRQSVDYFYSVTWLYVTLKVAEEHTYGPSARPLKRASLDHLDEISSEYDTEFNKLLSRCVRSDLIEEEVARYYSEVESDIDDRKIELDRSVAEDWQEVSSEANEHL